MTAPWYAAIDAEEGGSPSSHEMPGREGGEALESPPVEYLLMSGGAVKMLRGSRGYEAVCDGAWCSGAIYCGRKRGGLHLPQPEKCSKSDEELWIF